jgi:hypothetical protein
VLFFYFVLDTTRDTPIRRHVKPLVSADFAVVPTNPYWTRVVGYGPFCLCVIHKRGLCPSSGVINRLMMMMFVVSLNKMSHTTRGATSLKTKRNSSFKLRHSNVTHYSPVNLRTYILHNLRSFSSCIIPTLTNMRAYQNSGKNYQKYSCHKS